METLVLECVEEAAKSSVLDLDDRAMAYKFSDLLAFKRPRDRLRSGADRCLGLGDLDRPADRCLGLGDLDRPADRGCLGLGDLDRPADRGCLGLGDLDRPVRRGDLDRPLRRMGDLDRPREVFFRCGSLELLLVGFLSLMTLLLELIVFAMEQTLTFLCQWHLVSEWNVAASPLQL